MNSPSARRPIVIAHRGASGYLPEHSFAAKALAYGQGADYLEQDVIATRDGELIIFHDLTLDAVTNVAEIFPGRTRSDGHYYCLDFDLAELRSLSMHERLTAEGDALRYPGRFPREALGFPMQTLAEELAFTRGLNQSTGGNVGVYVEIKDPVWYLEQGVDFSAAVIQTLAEYGYLEPGQQVFLQCYDPATLRKVAADPRCTGLPLIQLIGRRQADLLDELDEVARYASGIGPSIDLFAPDFVAGKASAGRDLAHAAHAAGLAVHPYTFRADAMPEGCENFASLLKLFVDELGVDGLFTDFPDRVAQYLAKAQFN